jgi:hypothetical protein
MWGIVDEYRILEAMVACAMETESYVMRGTLLSTLSLVAVTPQITDRLHTLGFTVLTFGGHSCVVPLDLNSMVIRATSRLFVATEAIDPVSPVAQNVARLLNPLTHDRSKAELAALSVNQLASYENSLFVHRFLMSYHLDYETWQFVISLFHRIPLLPGDDSPVDTRLEAEAYARLHEAHLQAQTERALSLYTFERLPIPVFAKAEVPRARPGAREAAEVYISEQEFMALFSVDKSTFYTRCTEEQRREVREFIMRQ